MIKQLNIHDENTVKEIINIQIPAYFVEADLIGYFDIPGLKETLFDLQKSNETFAGYFEKNKMVGFISYKKEDDTLDIYKLCVHPSYFRKGIGSSLLEYVEKMPGITRIIVSTGSANIPAKKLYEKHGFKYIGEKIIQNTLKISFYEKSN